jgi:hypothetical protein
MEYVSGKVFFNDKLKWRASSAAQQSDMEAYAQGSHEAAEFLKKRLVTNQKLFGGVRYQPLTTGTTFGKVVFMSQEESYGSLEHGMSLSSRNLFSFDFQLIRTCLYQSPRTGSSYVTVSRSIFRSCAVL